MPPFLRGFWAYPGEALHYDAPAPGIHDRKDSHRSRHLAGWGDPRQVVTDPHARYFGAELGEGSLVPEGDDAILGEIRYED
ncbi:hypothetical protein [Streptosporangium vulgare]|uniref:Uncharacterized protein n=1 Tax=Streptosporangium vulgare TaxID=46190 RepID=A0ABV5TKW4_9ACTN